MIAFVLLAGGIGFYFLSAPPSWKSYPLDDAWIHMVYARNLVGGHFFSYNPPQPEAGFSSPLWVLITAGIHVFTGHVLGPKILGLVLLILLALCAKKLGGLAAGLLILLDPLLHFAALSGMEVLLFTFLSLLCLERQWSHKPGQAGIAAAFALLSRPEGVILPILLILLRKRSEKGFKDTLTQWIYLTGPCLVAAGLWISFCLLVTGRPFPNTFYAKVIPWAHPDVKSLFLVTLRFLEDEGPLFPLAAPILMLFAMVWFRDRRVLGALLFSLGIIVGVWATRPLLTVEAFYWERYLIPSLAGIHVLIGLGLKALWTRGSAFRALAILGGLSLLTAFFISLENKRHLYVMNCRDVARFHVAAGQWVKENTPRDDSIAVMDAGAIQFFGERETLDLAGLNSQAFTDILFLRDSIDIQDAASLAEFAKADWFIVFQRHYSGRSGFRLYHTISYSDSSFYVHPEPCTLLFLKKPDN